MRQVCEDLGRGSVTFEHCSVKQTDPAWLLSHQIDVRFAEMLLKKSIDNAVVDDDRTSWVRRLTLALA
mgnify:CR=1 FL=1